MENHQCISLYRLYVLKDNDNKALYHNNLYCCNNYMTFLFSRICNSHKFHFFVFDYEIQKNFFRIFYEIND